VEFEALLQSGPGGFRVSANVIWSALYERVFPTPGLAVNQHPRSVIALTKKPSAFVPLGMSLSALALVIGHAARYGIVHEGDEGAAAHIWQLLIAGHVPMVRFFTIKWLPRATRQTLLILALLAASLLANFASVFFLT
jgi:hypothetical protein